MITVTDKSLCCGCTACVAACPVQCIVMRRDAEGFDYPVTNPDICIGCGKCEEVCPMDKPRQASEPLRSWAAKNMAGSYGSSSGGIFPAVASCVLDGGGAVFGAAFQDVRTVGHEEVDVIEGLDALKGSKYVQSDMYSCYEDVRECLEAGRRVLFSGTPCQVAGLGAFLSKDYEGLVCVDCACHGVPGPGLWGKYVDALERKYGAKVEAVNFRDSSKGWQKYHICLKLADGRLIRTPKDDDPYMSLFFQDVTLRPSCYNCRFRSMRSGSDITVADLWSVARIAPEMADGNGVSLVTANTAKGLEIMESLDIYRKETDWRDASEGNGGFAAEIVVPARRGQFFSGLPYASELIPYMKSFVVRKPLAVRMYRSLHTALSRARAKFFKK